MFPIKLQALIPVIPLFFMAFNYDNSAPRKVMYFHSLKSLDKSDSPRQINMLRPDGMGKALVDGMLFTYKNRGAKQVSISGNFSGWNPERMNRSNNGIWYYFLPAGDSGRNLRYKFLVDGTWIMDPVNPDRDDDGRGSYLSVTEPMMKNEGRQVSYRKIGSSIEFRIYRPTAAFISLVGDFNNWNPEQDLLSRGKDGIWRLKKKLFPGTYRYKYIVDGDWVPDIYNRKSAADNAGEICSVIDITR